MVKRSSRRGSGPRGCPHRGPTRSSHGHRPAGGRLSATSQAGGGVGAAPPPRRVCLNLVQDLLDPFGHVRLGRPELLVLDPLPDTLGAGLLMDTSRGAAVQSLAHSHRMIPGDAHAARVALVTDRRGTALRIRVTTRAHPSKRRWPRRPLEPAEWVDSVTVNYPHPARISSAVGVRIPRESENAANRRRPHRPR